jgi:hypothetical protein
VASHNGPGEPPGAGVSQLAALPPMPNVTPAQLSHSADILLATERRYSLGWQDHRKAGPSFIVIREDWLGSLRVIERFPLTEQGWASAWSALAGTDASAARALAAGLAEREARRSRASAVAALDREKLSFLVRVKFSGGSGDVPLAQGRAYHLRFLADRLMISPPGSADATFDLAYRDAETVEIGGPGLVSWPPGAVLALTLALSLLGAWLGFVVVIPEWVGVAFGALIFGTVGALISAALTRTETIIQIGTADAEYFFMHGEKGPDALRIELSAQLRAIRAARRTSG